MQNLAVYFPIAQAITALLHPYAEVVIHDLQSGLIAALYNNFSKRKVGDESLIEDLPDIEALPDIFPVYLKTLPDGKKIKSCTTTLRTITGKPIGLLCINHDLSSINEMHQLLGSWLSSADTQKQSEILFKNDWREKINTYVSQYIKQEGLTLKTLSTEKKRTLVGMLYLEGAFKAKHAASYVADVLDLSRATIYNYLRQL